MQHKTRAFIEVLWSSVSQLACLLRLSTFLIAYLMSRNLRCALITALEWIVNHHIEKSLEIEMLRWLTHWEIDCSSSPHFYLIFTSKLWRQEAFNMLTLIFLNVPFIVLANTFLKNKRISFFDICRYWRFFVCVFSSYQFCPIFLVLTIPSLKYDIMISIIINY